MPPATSTTPSGPGKVAKQRYSKACKRCTRRKQRCHGFPVCRACDEAKLLCEPSAYALQLYGQEGYSNTGGNNNNGGGYVAFQRIQTLETQLAGALAELAVVRQQQHQLQLQQQQHNALQCADTNPFLLDSRSTTHDGRLDSRLQMPLLFGDADDANTLIDDSNGGSHTGAVPATVEQMVQATVWSKGLFSIGDGVPPPSPMSPLSSFSIPPPPQPLHQFETHDNESRNSSTMPQQPHQFPQQPQPSQQSPSPPPQPTDAMGRRMLDAYFSKIHPRYPFLDRVELFALHDSARHQTTTPPVLTLAHRFNVFRLNMVYAIGGTLLKITDPLCEAQAETYLGVALRDVAVVQDAQAHAHSTLQTIEGLVLLVLYNLRAPTNTGIWYLTNLAMQTCIDLRLHLEASYQDVTISEKKSRTMRRLFWSAYVLDRFIALSFKRPFSIAENDIETNIPDEKADGPMWHRFIEIKRLESRIQTDVYGFGEPREQRRAKIGTLLAAVDSWGESVSTSSNLTPSEVVYLQLQWNGAVAQLLRPFLSTMDRDDPLLARCLHASGNVCALFKEMHMRDAYGHSFVSAHLTFITGVTMCYCLFRASHDNEHGQSGHLYHLLDHRVANHLRACSSTMFIIAERYHRLRKHRNILEDIIGRIIDARMRANSGQAEPGAINRRHISDVSSAPAGKDHFSQLDFVAVQSLLNLAAQQEPETCTSPPAGSSMSTSTMSTISTISTVVPEPTKQTFTSTSVLPTNQALNPALNFNATGSWDVDRYSLEMLGRMIAPG